MPGWLVAARLVTLKELLQEVRELLQVLKPRRGVQHSSPCFSLLNTSEEFWKKIVPWCGPVPGSLIRQRRPSGEPPVDGDKIPLSIQREIRIFHMFDDCGDQTSWVYQCWNWSRLFPGASSSIMDSWSPDYAGQVASAATLLPPCCHPAASLTIVSIFVPNHQSKGHRERERERGREREFLLTENKSQTA